MCGNSAGVSFERDFGARIKGRMFLVGDGSGGRNSMCLSFFLQNAVRFNFRILRTCVFIVCLVEMIVVFFFFFFSNG